MDIHRLVKMANEIGTFFTSAEDHKEAVSSIAAHLRNFWDPRMRAQLIEYERQGGGELNPIVREAVLALETSRSA
jgi:formate dehydrogenase subunit delta